MLSATSLLSHQGHRVQDFLQWFNVHEAPSEWLFERERDIAHNIFVVVSRGVAAVFLIFVVCGAFGEAFGEAEIVQTGKASPYVVTICGCLAPFVFIVRRRLNNASWLTASRLLHCKCFFLYLILAAFQYIHVLVDHPLVKQRAFTCNVIIWKPLPLLFGLPMNYCIAASVWSFFHEVLSTLAAYHFNNDTFPSRLYVLLVFVHILYLSLARHQRMSLRQLYDAQELVRLEKETSEKLVKELQGEKEISANLLSMLCDASLWLAGDGDRVIRSEARFDAIMGHDMLDKRLSLFMSEEEQTRFGAILSTIQIGTVPVRSFPTTLQHSSSGASIVVDLLIAKRPEDMEEPLCELRYLVGLRVNSESSSHTVSIQNNLPNPDTNDFPTSQQSHNRRVCFLTGVVDDDASSSTSHTTSSRSRSKPRSCVKHACDNVSGHCGPTFGPPFAKSGEYLRDHSKSLLLDLVSSWNFHLQGCCAWHASLRYLEGMIKDIEGLRKCADGWKPEVVWQCQSCTALHSSSFSAEYCFLCAEAQDDIGD